MAFDLRIVKKSTRIIFILGTLLIAGGVSLGIGRTYLRPHVQSKIDDPKQLQTPENIASPLAAFNTIPETLRKNGQDFPIIQQAQSTPSKTLTNTEGIIPTVLTLNISARQTKTFSTKADLCAYVAQDNAKIVSNVNYNQLQADFTEKNCSSYPSSTGTDCAMKAQDFFQKTTAHTDPQQYYPAEYRKCLSSSSPVLKRNYCLDVVEKDVQRSFLLAHPEAGPYYGCTMSAGTISCPPNENPNDLHAQEQQQIESAVNRCMLD
jgi:hypothetical protein